ncbi:MAG: hypothetical protein M1543_03485, partial [Firmicutes bacterium]|nr:hypothetical protein [Bacillota bacterium]
MYSISMNIEEMPDTLIILAREYCLDERFSEELGELAKTSEAWADSPNFSRLCRWRLSLTDKVNPVIAGEMAGELGLEYSMVVRSTGVGLEKTSRGNRINYDRVKRDGDKIGEFFYR